MIVVIAILGILAAIAIPRFSGIRESSAIKADGATAKQIISAARIAEADFNLPGGTSIATVSGKVGWVEVASKFTTGDGEKYMLLSNLVPATGGTAFTVTSASGADAYVITWGDGKATEPKTYSYTEGTVFTGAPN